MSSRFRLAVAVVAGALAAVFLVVSDVRAAPVFVGSWNVNDGPDWHTNPLAYSGLGAAQLLFGPGSYEISTVDANPANIDHTAWYNVIGIGAGVFAENYFRGTEGVTHYQDVYVFDPALDTVSAYVHDFGDSVTINYAFRDATIPEPGSLLLLGTGLIGLPLLWRRRPDPVPTV